MFKIEERRTDENLPTKIMAQEIKSSAYYYVIFFFTKTNLVFFISVLSYFNYYVFAAHTISKLLGTYIIISY